MFERTGALLRRHLITAAALAAAALASPALAQQAKAFQPIDPHVQAQQMQRGVNIIGYDPLWKEGGKARFQAKHFRIIKEGGFNTVRVVLQSFDHMDANNQLSEQWLKKLDWVVEEATKNGLTVILDEHDFVFCGENAAACRPKLAAFWRQIAPRYKDTPNTVVFEILNEPNKQMDPIWNEVLAENLATIRQTNPTRNVIVGPASWNNVGWLDKLKLPANDRHLIVTVHYYNPMEFTHQGAPWVQPVHPVGVDWGTKADFQKLRFDLDKVQAWSKANNRPIFLGEFGAYDKGPLESRIRYTMAVAREAEKRGWAWAYWQFDSDFLLWDMEKDAWVEPIRQALIPPATR